MKGIRKDGLPMQHEFAPHMLVLLQRGARAWITERPEHTWKGRLEAFLGRAERVLGTHVAKSLREGLEKKLPRERKRAA